MGKILLTADIHLGLPKRLRDILWALKMMAHYARSNNIQTIMIMGDLFHDRVNLNIEVLAATYDFFDKNADVQFVAYLGNHDMFLRNEWSVNSLRPLNKVLTIVEDIKLIELLNARFWIVPFMNYESVYMKTLEKVEEQYEAGDVLLTHVGVHNAVLNECFLVRNWSVVNFDESKFDRVFTGHFHCHQQVTGANGRQNVWYPGSPIPFTYAEGAADHGFIVYDTDTREVEFVDLFTLETEETRPPLFITLPDDIGEVDPAVVAGNNIRVVLTRDYSRDELHRLRTSFKEAGAADVKWQQRDRGDTAAGETKTSADVSIAKPDELFVKWLAHDKPKGYSQELLLKLNDSIAAQAKERMRDIDTSEIET